MKNLTTSHITKFFKGNIDVPMDSILTFYNASLANKQFIKEAIFPNIGMEFVGLRTISTERSCEFLEAVGDAWFKDGMATLKI